MSTKVIFYCFRKDTKKSPVTSIYRPQRSWGKVMFLHVSVILFTGGWYPSMHCGWYPSMPCSRSPGGWYPSMPCRFPGPHPGGKLRGLARGVSRPTPKGEVEGSGRGWLQAHTRGGGWCLQAHTQRGVYPSMHWGRPPPGYCCGRYASYWNVFLSFLRFYKM